MTARKSLRNAAAVIAALAYDPATGVITWRVRKSQRVRAGDRAGCLNDLGYRRIEVDGVNYAAHHVAWLLTTGAWPAQEIDHINGDKDDNRFENLRDVSRAANLQNVNARGVTRTRSGKWKAQISVANRKKTIGTFTDEAEAIAAYRQAKARLHPTWRHV